MPQNKQQSNYIKKEERCKFSSYAKITVNPLKCSDVRQLHLKVFNAIQV